MLFVAHVSSEKLLFGASTNWSPTANLWSVMTSGFHTVKHVGYPYQFRFSLDGSPR